MKKLIMLILYFTVIMLLYGFLSYPQIKIDIPEKDKYIKINVILDEESISFYRLLDNEDKVYYYLKNNNNINIVINKDNYNESGFIDILSSNNKYLEYKYLDVTGNFYYSDNYSDLHALDWNTLGINYVILLGVILVIIIQAIIYLIYNRRPRYDGFNIFKLIKDKNILGILGLIFLLFIHIFFTPITFIFLTVVLAILILLNDRNLNDKLKGIIILVSSFVFSLIVIFGIYVLISPESKEIEYKKINLPEEVTDKYHKLIDDITYYYDEPIYVEEIDFILVKGFTESLISSSERIQPVYIFDSFGGKKFKINIIGDNNELLKEISFPLNNVQNRIYLNDFSQDTVKLVFLDSNGGLVYEEEVSLEKKINDIDDIILGGQYLENPVRFYRNFIIVCHIAFMIHIAFIIIFKDKIYYKKIESNN